jgi:hypothetical protein
MVGGSLSAAVLAFIFMIYLIKLSEYILNKILNSLTRISFHWTVQVIQNYLFLDRYGDILTDFVPDIFHLEDATFGEDWLCSETLLNVDRDEPMKLLS